MIGKIVLEEHFALPDTIGDSQQYAIAGSWSDLETCLLDFHGRRLSEMDRCGIDIAILSLNSPAIQAIPFVDHAIETARRTNDALAEAMAKRPDRLRGFAALPMQ